MGLMDRVKAQATQLAQQTKDAAEQGKAKLDQAQAGRRADAMLRQLGALVYADRTGRGTSDGQAKIDQLINDISAHERENGLNLTADPAAQATMPPQSTVPPQGNVSPESSGPSQTNFPPDPPSPFPGQPANEYGPGQTTGPGQTSPPDAGQAPPPQHQSFFPGPGSAGPESSGSSSFPPES
jgi:hypothetical protein